MKTNYTYIIVGIVVVIILGFGFWNRNKTQEIDDQIIDIATSTSTNTNTQNVQKPASSSSNTGSSKPVTKPAETPVPEPVPSIPSLSSLSGLIFRMTSYNGSAISADSRYMLSLENGFLNAKFCNNISGNFVLDGNLIKASNLIGTMMYCALPANLMEIESSFVSMLNFGGIIYQSGNKIILSSSSKSTVMVFTGF